MCGEAGEESRSIVPCCPCFYLAPVQVPKPVRAAKPQHVMDDDGTIEETKKKGTSRIDKALTANKAYE